MLGKLFHSKDPTSVPLLEDARNDDIQDTFHIQLIDKEQIRVVIFLESSSKSHVPLFDSLKNTWDTQLKAAEKKPTQMSPQRTVDNSNSTKLETSPSSSGKRTMLEGSAISEMLFGAIPLMQQQEGITTKIHIMKNDQQLMISKLFTTGHPTGINEAKDTMYLKQTTKKVVGVGVIIPIYRVGATKLQVTAEEMSLNYRMIKHFLASHYLLLDFRLQRLLEVVENSMLLVNDQPSGISSSSSIRSFHTVAASQSMKNLSSVSVRNYSSGAPQLESKPSAAFFFHKVDHVVEAVQDFQQHLFNLLGTTRLKNVIWLDLFDSSTSPKTIENTLECFFRALHDSQSLNATKTHFVLSAAVTGILCHHLSWLNTIKTHSTHDSILYHHTANHLSRHIEELFGSLRNTTTNKTVHRTFAKILVVGKNKKVVKQVLTVLSYFVRCSIDLIDDINYLDISWNSEPSLSTTKQTATEESTEPAKSTRATILSRLHVIEVVDYPTSSKESSGNAKLTKSLFAGYSENFFGDFVMMGVPSFDLPKLLDDLKALVESPMSHFGGQDPSGHADATSACLIVNIDECICEVITYTDTEKQSQRTPLDCSGSFNGIFRDRIIPSEHVTHTLQAALSFFNMGLPAASCALYIEDRLVELHSKIEILSKLLSAQPDMKQNDDDAIAVALGVTPGDLQLLFMLWSKTERSRQDWRSW